MGTMTGQQCRALLGIEIDHPYAQRAQPIQPAGKIRLSPTTNVRKPNCRTSPLQYQHGARVVTMISLR